MQNSVRCQRKLPASHIQLCWRDGQLPGFSHFNVDSNWGKRQTCSQSRSEPDLLYQVDVKRLEASDMKIIVAAFHFRGMWTEGGGQATKLSSSSFPGFVWDPWALLKAEDRTRGNIGVWEEGEMGEVIFLGGVGECRIERVAKMPIDARGKFLHTHSLTLRLTRHRKLISKHMNQQVSSSVGDWVN